MSRTETILAFLVLSAAGCAGLVPEYVPPYTPTYTPAVNQNLEAEYKARQDEERARLNSWVGHGRVELLESWGPPTNVIEDGDRQMWVYDKSSTILYPPPGSGLILPLKAEKYVMFWLDEEGTIYKITWKGY